MRLKSVIAALIGSGVIVASSAMAAQTQIKVWCWDDHFNVPAARMAAERYEAKHPDVKVKVESIGQPDIIQKLNASLGAKNTRTLPDVVLMEDYRVQNFLIGYDGFMKPLDGKVDVSNFVDYKTAASSYDGKHYGVPFDSGVTATFLRIDLFEKAGYKLEDLQDITWDKLIEMGKKVKEKTGTYLFAYDPSDLGIVRVMMQSAGSWYTTPDGKKVNLENNAAFREALTILKKMQDEDLVTYYNGWNQLLATFQQGAVSTVIQGCWITPSIEASKDQAGKWRIAPLPKLSTVENATHYSNLGGSQWYVNSYSKKADIAMDFLKETMAGNEELLNDLVPRISLVNALKDTSKITNYDKANEFFGGQKIYNMFAEWNNQIPAVNYGPHTYAIESICTEALQRVLGGDDIDAVLKDAQVNAEMQIGL